jgi:hypothetical protein
MMAKTTNTDPNDPFDEWWSGSGGDWYVTVVG